jgi:hypothetical protein
MQTRGLPLGTLDETVWLVENGRMNKPEGMNVFLVLWIIWNVVFFTLM